MNTNTVTIKTDRLLLTPISSKYREDIFAAFTSDISTYMFPQPTGDMKDTDAFITASIKENKRGGNLQLVAVEKETGEFFGCLGLHHIDRKTPEMGIWLKKEAHGKGYGKEAMAAIKQWADEHLDYEYILYPAAVKNTASRKIAEGLGGKLIREYVGKNANGDKLSEVEYRIYPA